MLGWLPTEVACGANVCRNMAVDAVAAALCEAVNGVSVYIDFPFLCIH